MSILVVVIDTVLRSSGRRGTILGAKLAVRQLNLEGQYKSSK